MPKVTDMKTGETKEISMEEFTDALNKAGGMEALHKAEEGRPDDNVVEDDMKLVNFFCNMEVIEQLTTLRWDYDNDKQSPLTMDIIEHPLQLLFTYDTENLYIRSYTRMDLYSPAGDASVTGEELRINRKTGVGAGSITIQDSRDIVQKAMHACKNLSYLIVQKGWDKEYTDLDPYEAGLMLSYENNDFNVRVVSGKDRPDLMCKHLFGGMDMCRPYFDELLERSAKDMMDPVELIRAGEDGDEEAMQRLAMAYLDGDEGFDADPEKAVYWNRKLADLGDPIGMFNLGLYAAKGYGTTRDFIKAAEWMDKAAAAGDPDADAVAEEYRKMANSLEKAEAGDAKAQADLAAGYMRLSNSLDQAGPGEDYAESIKWAQKSAEQNNGDGIWTLALAYEHGRGVEQDKKRAVELYQKGADLGHAKCQHSLGAYYMRGEIVPDDKKMAFELFTKSAEQGYGLAMQGLGSCYQLGLGTEDDMDKAIYWYEKSLEVQYDPEIARKVSLFKDLRKIDKGIEAENGIGKNAESGTRSNDLTEQKGYDPRFILSYNKGIRSGDEKYTIGIPDSFEIDKNVDDRAFIAWLPDGAADYTEAKIVFYDGKIVLENDNDPRLYTPEASAALLENSFWNSPLHSLFQGAKIIPLTERYPGGIIIAQYELNDVEAAFHYNIQLCFKGCVKGMRVMVIDVTEEDIPACDKMVIDWINTLELTEPLDTAKKLDDPSFTAAELTEESADEWKSCSDTLYSIIFITLQQRVAARAGRYQIHKDTGDSIADVIKDGQKYIETAASEYGKFLKNALDGLETITEKNKRNPLLKKLYEVILPCIAGGDHLTVDSIGSSAEIPGFKDVRKRFLVLMPEAANEIEDKKEEASQHNADIVPASRRNQKKEADIIASEQIHKYVTLTRESANHAEREYDEAASEIQRKSSNSINLYGGSATRQVVELASMSKKACESLYASYQTLVRMLDENCRPLLAKGPSAASVKEVADLITWLNNESEIENNFTASFNSASLGDVANVRFFPTMENKMIQQYWTQKYREMPDYEENEQRIKAEKEAEQKARREKKEEEKAATLEWKKEKKIRNDSYRRVEAECKDREEKFKSELDQYIERKQAAATNTNAIIIANLKDRKNEAEAALGELGAGQTFEKQQLNNYINKQENRITAITSESQNDDIKNAKKKAKKACDEYKKQTEEYLKKRFPFDQSLFDNRIKKYIVGEKGEILSVLTKIGAGTVEEIMKEGRFEFSSQICSAYLTQLVLDGIVRKEVIHRMTFFEIRDDMSAASNSPLSPGIDGFYEDTSVTDDSMPVPPRVEELFDDLESLTEEYAEKKAAETLLKMKQEDDEIKRREDEERRLAEEKRKDEKYQTALAASEIHSIGNQSKAVVYFTELGDWRDSEQKKAEAEKLLSELVRKRNKKIKLISFIIAAAVIIGILTVEVIIPTIHYNQAVALLEDAQYDQAIEAFEAMDGFRNSEEMIMECKYRKALSIMEEGEYEQAIKQFENIKDYKDSTDKIEECEKALSERAYQKALEQMKAGNYADAIKLFESIDGYKNSREKIEECNEQIVQQKYENAMSLKESGKYENAITLFSDIADYKDSKHQIEICKAHRYSDLKAGDKLDFGNYNNTDLSWKVLGREGNSILLITEYIVDERHFQSNQNDPKYYKDSPIRSFLDKDFYEEAFTKDQKKLIEKRTLSTTGGDVSDKVFLLSDSEAKQYFRSDADRAAPDKKTWFLRTVNPVRLKVLNSVSPIAMQVTGKGAIYQNDDTTDYERGIRPAIWLDISSYVEIANE